MSRTRDRVPSGPSVDPVAAARLCSQLLSAPPAASALAVTEHLLAVQGQDPRGARLAIRARTHGLTAGEVDRALTEDRTLLITWLNRGTLHLVASADYWWLHALTTPQLATANTRRLAQEGVSPDQADRGVLVVARVASDGPSTRRQLRGALLSAGVPVQGQALVHILVLASLRGLLVRGPMVDGEQAFVLARDWLGVPPPELEREQALARLAHRYLVGHGPASDRDLAKWAGVTLGDSRRAFTSIAHELVDRPDGLAALTVEPDPNRACPPRLLGAFDPLLLGWVSREPYLGSHQGIVTVNGLFRPFALVGSRAVGTWTLTRGEVVLAPFAEIGSADAEALRLDAQDVVRFLGLSGRPGKALTQQP
ncbi:MAG: winged helix DNA-binding domain-containing protein [Candidatus Nanopelagicales bacterium]